MTNQPETASNDRMERARAILQTCLEMRKRVYDFLQMKEGVQKEQNQEEIHVAFSHLANCKNQEAFIVLTGKTDGSGLCNALWKKINQEYDDLSDLVCEHLTRIKYPDLWQDLEEEKRKQERGEKPGFRDRIFVSVASWMFSGLEKSEAKRREKKNQQRGG